jgi:hypothetical protein
MSRVKKKYSECLNCGERLGVSFSYCPQCGQANHDLNIPVRHFVEETAEGILHFDAKSLRTIHALMLKPGVVTSEFVAGKRAKYVAPMRFYIFISFLFFLLLSYPSSQEKEVSTDSHQNSVGITFYKINSRDVRGMKSAQLDSVLQSEGLSRSVFNRYIVRKLSRIGTEGQEGFNHVLLKAISYMMFALMPIFALFVFILYRKRAMYYFGTLVFSVHYHSFVFLLLSVTLIVDRIVDNSLILAIPVVLCPVYLYLALRRMFDGSRLGTISKTIVLGVFQCISFILVFLATMFISILIF